MATIYKGFITPEELKDLIYKDQAAKGMRLVEGCSLTRDIGSEATEVTHDIWFEVEIMPREQTENSGPISDQTETQTTGGNRAAKKPRKEKVPFEQLPESTRRRIEAMNRGKAARKQEQGAQQEEETNNSVVETEAEQSEDGETQPTDEVVAASEVPFQN